MPSFRMEHGLIGLEETATPALVLGPPYPVDMGHVTVTNRGSPTRVLDSNYLIASRSSSGAVFSFDRSASSLKQCKDSDFRFDIVPTDDGNEQAVFQIWKDGALVRENKSTPFPPGALTKKSCNVKKENCLVEVKNPGGLDLDSLFP